MLSHLAAFVQLQQVTVLAVHAAILCAHTQLPSPGHAGLCQERCFCALTLSQTGDRTLYHIYHNTGHLRLVDQVCSITKDESSLLHFSPATYKKSSFLPVSLLFVPCCYPCAEQGVTRPRTQRVRGKVGTPKLKSQPWVLATPPAVSTLHQCFLFLGALRLFAQGEKDHANDLPQRICGSCLSRQMLPSPQLCHATQYAHEFSPPLSAGRG